MENRKDNDTKRGGTQYEKVQNILLAFQKGVIEQVGGGEAKFEELYLGIYRVDASDFKRAQ